MVPRRNSALLTLAWRALWRASSSMSLVMSRPITRLMVSPTGLNDLAIVDGQRQSAAEAYLRPLPPRPNLTLSTWRGAEVLPVRILTVRQLSEPTSHLRTCVRSQVRAIDPAHHVEGFGGFRPLARRGRGAAAAGRRVERVLGFCPHYERLDAPTHPAP